MNRKILLLCAFVVFASTAFSGCGPRESRSLISGTVTNDGEPLPVGVIQFLPENPDPAQPVAGATIPIKNGRYEMTDVKLGLLPGKYKVRVVASVMRDKQTGEIVNPDDVKDGLVNPLACDTEDLVPPRYGSESEEYVEIGKTKETVYDLQMVSE